ncbi:rCG33503 [Rattus norvegicus]|uniref:RCG33503 n=1 Tax=Rattus norvegicus TaxID=10116 RepID=A6HCZ4_RAT|nr:rCG33503 [Rattus norvegicus]
MLLLSGMENRWRSLNLQGPPYAMQGHSCVKHRC